MIKQKEYQILSLLAESERSRLSVSATLNEQGLRRKPETNDDYRQPFAKDADRILHSRAYTRYIDKTQVFCLVSNDHITHRVLHVQLVSRIARTIGRFLFLNEDLIEAIALGHDIGHPPFGHAGESFLSALCLQHDLPPFQHNIHSVHALEAIERKGSGWNLTLQTLDGILCHDGEIHSSTLTPEGTGDFDEFDRKISQKVEDPKANLQPMTMEGCVVRMADTIAYIGRDIEDAIILGLIDRADIPEDCSRLLGNTNGKIVYNLVTDLVRNSSITPPRATDANRENDYLSFSSEVSQALKQLKAFNYENIYYAPETKRYLPMIQSCYNALFESYINHIKNGTTASLSVDLMSDLQDTSGTPLSAAIRARDFIAGMTDDFFIQQARAIGCEVPPKMRELKA
ncbi:MAG: HD domain-containing protein [Desulfobulbaceae bacterium]|nr:MAG: HD domain-containing protein [Desulfobulbaceae bacterium]